ncbi:PAS domain-containing protein [Malaciobacter mytili]
MLKQIRIDNKDIPVIFATAYSESKFLLDAIKLNTAAYILKPYDVEDMILKIQQITKDVENSKLVKLQQVELEQYISVIDKVAIISRTNKKGVITFVNQRFCETSGYTKDELLGEAHNIVRHPEMPSQIFQTLWDEIKVGKMWQGKVKNRAKNGEPYYVNATIIPRFNAKNEIVEYIGIRFLITDDENEKRKFKKNILSSIKESKQKETLYLSEIKKLESNIKTLEKAVLFRNEAYENEKEKSSKQYSQLLYYEKEIKNLNNNMEKTRKESYDKLFELVNKLKKFKIINDDLKKKNDKLSLEMNLRRDEFVKLNDQVREQSKIISNLKEVIEHREHQLERTKKL